MNDHIDEIIEVAESDSIDANIESTNPDYFSRVETADTGFVEISSIQRLESRLREWSFSSPRSSISNLPEVIDGHKLLIPGLAMQYVYELEPRTINGKRYFEYGLTATANKKPYVGFILHHMGDAPFSNSVEYIIKRDEERKGTFGYHFLIGRDGRVVQAAPLSKRTNHVSGSDNRYAQKALINENTISLSLHGGYKKVGKEYVHVPATSEQLEVSKTIIRSLSQIYSIPLANAWGHGEVQSNRMREEAKALAEWCRDQSPLAPLA